MMNTTGPDVESDHNVVHPHGQMNVGNGPRHENNERNNNDNQFTRADNHNKAVVHLKDNWKSISVCALLILALVVFLSTYLPSRTGNNNTNPVLKDLAPFTGSESSTPTTTPTSWTLDGSQPAPSNLPKAITEASATELSPSDRPTEPASTNTPAPTPAMSPTPTLATTLRRVTSKSNQAAVTAEAKIAPGSTCKADSDCAEGLCYSYHSASATCCGSTMWGCPGYDCEKSRDNGCLDPYKCATTGSTRTCVG